MGGGSAASKPPVEEVDNTMRTSLFYDTVKIDGPKKKILEFNEADKFMDEKEVKHFNSLCEVLVNKDMFYKTKIDEYHSALLSKLLTLPVAKVFPCLDLYRIFLLHPDMVTHYKNFEQGWNHISAFIRILQDKNAPDPAKMLALRCIVNTFKDQSACFILFDKREKVIEAVSSHL